MEKLRVHQRWMALPWGGIGMALALVFAAVGVYSIIMYPEDEPSVRVAIPMYVLALYWVVALSATDGRPWSHPKAFALVSGRFSSALPDE